jgi:Protein of unknown function (DUF3800)
MYVFIDDSGDAGFQIDKGSSQHLVIACCVFTTATDAENAASTIRQFRESLRWNSNQEFKFAKTHPEIRLAFLRAVRPTNFFVRACVIDKSEVNPSDFSSDKESFYNFAIQEVLTQAAGIISYAKVKVDGRGSREYVAASTKYFKAQANLNSLTISKVTYVDSKGDQLIQLADMIAGAIRKTVESGNKSRGEYRAALAPFLNRPGSAVRHHKK